MANVLAWPTPVLVDPRFGALTHVHGRVCYLQFTRGARGSWGSFRPETVRALGGPWGDTDVGCTGVQKTPSPATRKGFSAQFSCV